MKEKQGWRTKTGTSKTLVQLYSMEYSGKGQVTR